MTKFEKRFFKSLNEQAEEERAAFEAELEDNTEAGDFDVDVEVDEVAVDEDPNVKAAQAVSERNAAMRTKLESWVGEIEQFLEYLNGSSPDSIQTLLANAEPDTIFDRMKASEQRKIARVATELAALNESFKGYIAQTGNAQFKYV
jgi:HSP90 family molecular chaperone|tara:strand:+ start:32 stop:469 length:438 start_codon:yes stop_codon:yes gene_type:complete